MFVRILLSLSEPKRHPKIIEVQYSTEEFIRIGRSRRLLEQINKITIEFSWKCVFYNNKLYTAFALFFKAEPTRSVRAFFT